MESQFHLCGRAGSRLYPHPQTPVSCYMELIVSPGVRAWALVVWTLRFPSSEGVLASQRADSSSNPSSLTANSSPGTGVSSRMPNAHLKNSSQPCPGRWGGLALVNLLLSAPENLFHAMPGISGNRACRGNWEVRVAMPFCLFVLLYFFS